MNVTLASQALQRKQSARPSEYAESLTYVDGVAYWGDAQVMTPGYDPDADANLHRPITISLGARAKHENWVLKTLPLDELLANLCTHKEGKKDGAAFVTAELAGKKRLETAVKAIWAVGLDLDTGTPLKEISAAVGDLGVLAVIYTTHSHDTTQIEVKKDQLVEFAAGRDYETNEVCKSYLREKGYHPTIVESAEYVETVHGADGIVAVIATAPIPKTRVIFPLETPFVIATAADTQREAIDKWRRIAQAVADMLGVRIDKTGSDPNRLFYFPRHPKGAKPGAAIFGGPLLDWRAIDLKAAPAVERAKKGPTTDAGRDLLCWAVDHASGFQVADAIEDHCPERKRDGRDIECPFDDEHSNPGDPQDRACMAINAQEGTSSRFVVKCQHDSCRERDNLDMLGKMLADGWFGEEVLEAPEYNPTSGEGDGEATAAKPSAAAEAAIKRRDEARQTYQAAVEALTTASTDEAAAAAADLIVAAGLEPIAMMEAVDALKTKLGARAPVAQKIVTAAEARAKEAADAGATKRSRGKRRDRKAKAADRAWMDRLNTHYKTGEILPTLPNLRLIIEHDPRSAGIVALNQFTGETVLRRAPGCMEGDGALQLDAAIWWPEDQTNGDLWTDAHDNQLRMIIEAPEDEGGYDVRVSDRDLGAAVDYVAHLNRFHPVRDYLKGLKWDGEARVESLFVDYVGAEDNPYHRKAAWLFAVGAVTRAFEPGHKLDESVILEGLQGGRKTTFIETLAVDWYGELTASWEDPKGVVEQTQGVWIAELGELTGMSKADVRAVKSGLSRHTDKVRLAYARRAQEFPRHWVCIGSTNDSAYLRDLTGGRRFLPVACKVESIDIERLRGEVDQIWAEAYDLYCKLREAHPVGRLPLWLSDAEARDIAKKLQASRTIDTADDAIAGVIEAWLDHHAKARVCLREVWEDGLERHLDDYTGAAPEMLGRVMRSLPEWASTGGRDIFGKHGQQRVYARDEEKAKAAAKRFAAEKKARDEAEAEARKAKAAQAAAEVKAAKAEPEE